MDPECGSTDEAKKVFRLLRVGISPIDCESAKRISSPGCVNDAENGEEVSFVPSGPSRFSYAAYIQVRLTTAGVASTTWVFTGPKRLGLLGRSCGKFS